MGRLCVLRRNVLVHTPQPLTQNWRRGYLLPAPPPAVLISKLTKYQLSELFQANASASNETIASSLAIKQRVFALQGLTEKIEKEHVVESDDGRMYRQAWALWNTPAASPPLSRHLS